MKLAWAAAAEQDRADIFDYISADNPLAAIRMDELFDDAAARLEAHPLMGRKGKTPGTLYKTQPVIRLGFVMRS